MSPLVLAQLLATARAQKAQFFLTNSFEALFVICAAPGLQQDWFIAVQAMSVEGCQDCGFCALSFARRIQIFNSDEPYALISFGMKITYNCGEQGAKMEGAGW